MFYATFKTSIKRIVRAPSMLFTVPVIMLMLQEKIFPVEDQIRLFSAGAHMTMIGTAQLQEAHISLFNHIFSTTIKVMPILILIATMIVLRDFFNESERDVLFAANISFGKLFLAKIFSVFVLALGIFILFVAGYMLVILPGKIGTASLLDFLPRALLLTTVFGINGILTYMSFMTLITAISGSTTVGGAALLLFVLLGRSYVAGASLFFYNVPVHLLHDYLYFPQRQLFTFFYYYGTEWFDPFMEYYLITKENGGFIALGTSVAIITLSFTISYFLLGRKRVKEQKAFGGDKASSAL